MFGASEDPLHELVVEHGQRAIETADVLVFVVDGREGLVPGDEEIASDAARRGRAGHRWRSTRPTTKRARGRRGRVLPARVRAGRRDRRPSTATGVGDLLDEVVERLPRGAPDEVAQDDDGEADAAPESAEVGDRHRRPAERRQVVAGQSAAAEERMIVSEMPGTTRDAVDAVLRWHRRTFRIVDTAGIRRPGRVARSGQVESLSVLVARRAIEKADVVVLVIDASEGATDQDAAIAGEAEKAGCGVIIAANKWDLMKGRGPDFSKEFDDKLRRQLKFLDYAPILHISALTGERTPKVLEMIDKVAEARAEARADAASSTASSRRSPPRIRRRARAARGADPLRGADRRRAADVRLLHERRDDVPLLYERFLVNRLRESFGFLGHADPDPGAAAGERGRRGSNPAHAGCEARRREAEAGRVHGRPPQVRREAA